MSETPTEAALEAARKAETACTHPLFDSPPRKNRGACRACIAAALDAYATERIEDATDGDRTFARLAQVERERDAALARAEAAEARVSYRSDFVRVEAELDATRVRVLVLESALLEIRERAGREGRASQVARAALAKAAAADGGE